VAQPALFAALGSHLAARGQNESTGFCEVTEGDFEPAWIVEDTYGATTPNSVWVVSVSAKRAQAASPIP
jgi:hypothetical protein